VSRAAAKIGSVREVAAALNGERCAGRTIALANGLFDVLHVGHVRYLQGAAEQADILVVAINSDDSARSLKGPDRPFVPQDERAEIVAGLSCVDHVVIFPERDAAAVLRALRPDVHCKGTDYTAETVPEREVAREIAARIAIVGDPKSHASRDLVRRIREVGTNDGNG
jgi:rfaE bifunctional protein nucleotidyltransferase chain/domain